MSKRKIKPYRGGRTARFSLTYTPEEKAEIKKKARECKMRVTDLILEAVRAYQATENG